MCGAELLFYYVAYVLFIAHNKKNVYNCPFRFREAPRFARNILNHQTFETTFSGKRGTEERCSSFCISLDSTFSKKKESKNSLHIKRKIVTRQDYRIYSLG